ncbi:hypothetical protein H5410_005290 [Solanum commersonii]|uniref:Uncharacterized protein n=1 Tax=Solanum commersonii TaxID=4109 RepID=A0A9J6A6R8_SOLCO|nr:hypothetical protein H5410_005290 [Solanum commersonii]
MAAAVGKPLVIDKSMNNQTRPSCVRVKVEIDPLKELPKRIQINCDMMYKDWVLHLEHRPKKEEKQEEEKAIDKGKAKEEETK